MEFKKYMQSLLPSFEKSRIMDDVRILREEMVDHTLPPLKNAEDVFGRYKFQSKEIKDFEKEFDKRVETRTRGNFVVVISQTMENAKDVLYALEQMADKNYKEDIVKNGITYLKANILQYLEMISFATRYSRKLLLWTYAAETNNIEGNTREQGRELTKPEREWMEANKDNFFRALSIMGGKPKDIEKTLDAIPDMVIDPENSDEVTKTVGLNKLDPYKFGLVPLWMNPIYHVRLKVAEWQVARINAAKEEKKGLEYRLLYLKDLNNNQEPDAKLKENIEYTEERIRKLNYKLAKMQEDD